MPDFIKQIKHVHDTGAYKYADGVLSGNYKVGTLIYKAAERFMSDVERDDIYFDLDLARKVVNYPRLLRHWKGTKANTPIILELHQEFYFQQMFGWKRTDTNLRRFTRSFKEIARKNGKALCLETDIPTPKGWRKMSDLKIGDYVYGDDGKAAKIILESEIENKPTYRMTFTGGCTIDSSEDHLWEIYKGTRKRGSTPQVLTTNEILQIFKPNDTHPIKVRVAQPVEYCEKRFFIPPYVLGAWLGDGHSVGSRITVHDDDVSIVENIRKCGFDSCKQNTKDRTPNYKLGYRDQLNRGLRNYNLIKNKHIPRVYLESSIDQRMELLQGLMDTDGTITKRGQCSYSGINKRLVEDVHELTLSLGLKSTFRSRISKMGDYQVESFSVDFFTDKPVFKLERKKDRLKKKLAKRSLYRSITKIEYLGEKPVKCIGVENESHLFLAGKSFIPTHNTTELAIQALYHCHIDLTTGPSFYVGATKEDQARITLLDAANILPPKWVSDNTFRVYKTGKYPREIIIEQNKGSLSTVGRDSKRSDGLDVSFAGIDEYHEHPDTSIRDILASAQGNRIEPLESIITTAGYNISGPCYTKSRETGIKILDGILEDDQQLVIICEMDDWDDWENEEEWICANPMMDSVPSLMKDLKEKFTRAKNEGGSTEVDFQTKRLNMWVNSPETWIPYEIIKENNHGVEDDELIGRECYGGLDLSAGTDLNAYVLFFPNVRENVHAVKSWFWIPEDKLLSKEADYNSLKSYMEVFDGNTVEYSKIARTMLETLERYDVKSWGCDPAYLSSGPAQYLGEAGKGELIEKVSQGRNLAAATNNVEAWAHERSLDFLNNPVMFWNFSNVIVAQTENGHRYPSKKKSENKIDGVSALCTAVHEYLRLGSGPPPIEPTIEVW